MPSTPTGLLVNTRAGTVSRLGVSAVIEAARSAFGADLFVETGDGPDMLAGFERLRRRGVDRLLVAGGDGTVAGVAAKASEAGIALAPLPGGTLNLLPRRLYGDIALLDLLPRLKWAQTRPYPLMAANDEVFLLAAMFGMAYPVTRMREKLREGEVGRLPARAAVLARRVFRRRCRYAADGEEEARAEIILAANGPLDDVLAAKVWDGETLPLEAAAGRWRNLFDVARAFGLQAAGASSLDPATDRFGFDTLRVRDAGRRHTRLVLDGEPVRIDGPVTVKRRAKPVMMLKDLDE